MKRLQSIVGDSIPIYSLECSGDEILSTWMASGMITMIDNRIQIRIMAPSTEGYYSWENGKLQR